MASAGARRAGVAGVVWLTALGVLAPACKRTPPDLREWRPSDHSRNEGESPGAPEPPSDEDNDPMIAAQAIWNAQCALCHGLTGHGDGPQAALTHPRDLSDPAFQSTWSDAQIRDVIMRGRNMMPAFGANLRPEGVDALVRLVRHWGQR